MAFDINNFVIDETKRVFSRNPDTGAMNFLVAQIEDAQITCDSEEVTKNDAKGTPIAKWSQAKTANFSASNSLLDFSLMSWQFNGEGKTVATSGAAINAPAIEEHKIVSGDSLTEYVLANSVVAEADGSYKITVALLTRDGACKENFTVITAGDVSTGKAKYDATNHKLTFASGDLAVGDKLFVAYEYSTENAVAIYNSADKYATAQEMWVEVLGHDICSVGTIYHGYVVFPNSTLSASTTVALTRDSSFPFEFSASQNYCDDEHELFRIVIPQPASE